MLRLDLKTSHRQPSLVKSTKWPVLPPAGIGNGANARWRRSPKTQAHSAFAWLEMLGSIGDPGLIHRIIRGSLS